MYKSIPDGFKTIYRTEGLTGFKVVSSKHLLFGELVLTRIFLIGLATNLDRIFNARIWKVRIL